MMSLQLPLLLCCICAVVVSKNIGKREVGPPEFARGGFAASNGPYGTSSLNYQVGNQGNYNNVDYNDYRSYNPPQPQNIPVQEQHDGPNQNVRVPVWSPPGVSQNPYAASPQPQTHPLPQTAFIQVPIQQAIQTGYQQGQQQPIQVPYQQNQQQPIQVSYQQNQQQQEYIPQQPPQEIYANQANIPQQFSIGPQTYSNDAPTYLGSSSSVNDPSLYNNGPFPAHSTADIPPNSYQSNIPPQTRPPPSISSAANIASSYSSGLHSLPSLHGRGLVSRLRAPQRFAGKSFGSAASSSFDGRLRNLDEVLGSGIGDFNGDSFGGHFGGSLGSGGFSLGTFGNNYFSGLGGGFNNFGGSFPNFSAGGLKSGFKGSPFSKFSSLGPISGSSIANYVPTEGKAASGVNNQGSSTSQHAIPSSDVSAGAYTSSANANSISQAPQTQPVKN